MVADGIPALLINSYLENRRELIRAVRLFLSAVEENPSIAAVFKPEHIEYARLVVDSVPDTKARPVGAL